LSWRPRAAGAFMASAVVLALAGCGSSSPPSRASTPSTGASVRDLSTLEAAATTMEGVPGYRFTATVVVATETTRVVGVFQAPDRVQETIDAPGATPVEVVFTGSLAFVRQAGGKWFRPTTPLSPAQSDPRAAFGALSGAQDVTYVAGWYQFKLSASAAAQLLQAGNGPVGSGTGRAHLSGSGIDGLELNLVRAGRVADISLEYSDVGSAPPVTQPVLG